jgi:APA family basic amino acid/polyamine antiporter
VSDNDPSRARISGVHATALVVANMVGTGIFTTSGFLIADLGRPLYVLGLWLLGGLAALCGALVYAELGAALRRAGGEVVFLARAWHPSVAFAAGWISLIVGFAAPVAASAMAFGKYLNAATGAPPLVSAVLLIIVVSFAHAGDVRLGGRFQLVVTGVKLVLLFLLLTASLTSDALDPGRLLQAAEGVKPSWSAAAVGLIFVSYSYSGWNAAAYLAGEIDDAERNIPRALLLGSSFVTVLYLALNALFFSAVPAAELAGKIEVGHVATVALFGEEIGRAFSTAIALALVSSVSAMILAGPRVAVFLAEEKLLPAALGKRRAGGSPVVAVLSQAVLAIACALTATFDSLLMFVGFTLSITAAATVLGAWRLRITEPDLERPFRTPLWPLPPLVFVGLATWMVVFSLSERPWAGLAGVLVLALVGAGAWLNSRKAASSNAG